MGELRLTLLGGLLVARDGAPLMGWALQKSLALLAYLAVTGCPHSRGALADLLWPANSEAAARSNLRKTLVELRRKIPSHLTVTRTEVAFNRASPYWLDVEAFERGIGRAPPRPRSPLTAEHAVVLAGAIELYRGDYLLGLDVRAAPTFEEWVLFKRERLRNLALRGLEALVDHYVAEAQLAPALAAVDRLLALEPAHEEAHRHKMRLLAAAEQRTAALRQYEVCRQALRALDVEPEQETRALCQQIRSGVELPAPHTHPVEISAPDQNLHAPLAPLVGREAELSEIRERLRDPGCRLLTLIGLGGVGKTHLALQFAADLQSAHLQSGGLGAAGPPGCFQDGVYVVRLAAVPTVEAILPAIVRALGLPPSEGVHPQQQIVKYVCGKRLLMIMDGFEHLPAGAGLLVDLLQRAPSLKILVTSQARLNLQAEHLFYVGGLACPHGLADERACPATAPAVQLFLSNARRIRPGLAASAEELQDIARICRLVQGLPLAILAAAGWAGMLTPAEIVAQLEGESGSGLDFLQTNGQDLPAGQRSMRAVLDHSWELLLPGPRAALAALAVFRGSFTPEAAYRVAGVSLQELRELMDRSLVEQAAAGRYALHELLRQYAGEKLLQTPGAAREVRDRHSAYFAAALEQWAGDLQGSRCQATLAEMHAQNGNLRPAWDWAVERGQVAQLDRAMEGLCYFYKWLGRHEEGESLCRHAAERLAGAGEMGREESFEPSEALQAAEPAERERVRARALAWQGVFCLRQGRREEARELQRSRHWLDEPAWTAPGGDDWIPSERSPLCTMSTR